MESVTRKGHYVDKYIYMDLKSIMVLGSSGRISVKLVMFARYTKHFAFSVAAEWLILSKLTFKYKATKMQIPDQCSRTLFQYPVQCLLVGYELFWISWVMETFAFSFNYDR
ncbi:hypothetical protein STEG23_022665 [Scotinomys teguina]